MKRSIFIICVLLSIVAFVKITQGIPYPSDAASFEKFNISDDDNEENEDDLKEENKLAKEVRDVKKGLGSYYTGKNIQNNKEQNKAEVCASKHKVCRTFGPKPLPCCDGYVCKVTYGEQHCIEPWLTIS